MSKKVARVRVSRRRSEQGLGVFGVLMAFGGVCLAWFIFMGIMDAMRGNHRAKLKERMERMVKKKPVKDNIKREAKGYKVSY